MKKKLTPEPVIQETELSSTMPLNKAIAHAGVCSRRAAVALIEKGFVTVNSKMVRKPAHKVTESDVIKVRGRVIKTEKKVYVVLNKPKGFITTVSDEVDRKTIMDLVDNKDGVRLYPVGRLDVNTTGVIILTNDGSVAQKLAHPRYTVKKEYSVTLHKPLHEEDQKHIQAGMRLQDGRIEVDTLSFPTPTNRTIVRIALHSGRYRIIRRIFESVGYMVEKLDRVSYAGISKRGLAVGQWRYLTSREIKQLQELVTQKTTTQAVPKVKRQHRFKTNNAKKN